MVFKRGGLFSEVVVRWVSAVFVFYVLICCLVVDAGVWHGLFCFLTNNGIKVWYIDHISIQSILIPEDVSRDGRHASN